MSNNNHDPQSLVKDSQHLKYHLVLNNPIEKGYTHDHIKEICYDMKSLVYACMSDEQGETYHTHLFLAFSSSTRFSTMKRRFPEAHIEPALGTSQSNRDYILKEGRWANDDKHGTSIPESFEEFGEMPLERQGARTDLELVYQYIKDGWSDAQILEALPDQLLNLDRISRARQVVLQDAVKDTFRKISTTFIWGKTGVGKTRFVMDTYGYGNVHKTTDYKHPFDHYLPNHTVLLLDEFDGQLKLRDMLQYLDGYPIALPARYSNRWACFDRVYIISNNPLEYIYRWEQLNEPEVYRSFLRRIHQIMHFHADGTHDTTPMQDYRPLQAFLSDSDNEFDDLYPYEGEESMQEIFPESNNEHQQESLKMPDSETLLQ